MLRRLRAWLLSDRGRIASSPTIHGWPADPEAPDAGERRLGWIAVSIALGAVVVVGATLSTLLPIRDAADVSVSPQHAGAAAVPDVSSAPVSTAPSRSAAAAPTTRQPGTVADVGDGGAPSPVAPAAQGRFLPSATVRPPGNATTAPAPVTRLPADVQAAVAAVHAVIHHQIDTRQLDPSAGADLLGTVDQVARELGGGDWRATASDASTLWKKLGRYRDGGRLSATGYQAIVAALQDVRTALATR